MEDISVGKKINDFCAVASVARWFAQFYAGKIKFLLDTWPPLLEQAIKVVLISCFSLGSINDHAKDGRPGVV